MDVEYARWYAAESKYRVASPNVYFEPYFVVRTNEVAKFDERYRGYGAGDKALHFHLLFKAGFKVYVLADHFLLHVPHPQNNWQEGRPAVSDYFNGFHSIDRMTYGIHMIDFWTRVVGNCVAEPCDVRPTCSAIPSDLTGGSAKCSTDPDRFKPRAD